MCQNTWCVPQKSLRVWVLCGRLCEGHRFHHSHGVQKIVPLVVMGRTLVSLGFSATTVVLLLLVKALAPLVDGLYVESYAQQGELF